MAFKLNFKKSLIAFSTLLVGLAVILSNIFSYLGTERLLLDRIQTQMETGLTTQVQSLERRIVQLSTSILAFAEQIELAPKSESFHSLARTMTKAMGAEAILMVLDVNGNDQLYSSRTETVKLAPSTLTQQKWYQQALDSSHVVVSDPYLSATSGKLVFNVSKKIKSGVVFATFNTQLLENAVNQAASAAKFAILMASDGAAIYSNNPAVIPGENTKNFAPSLYQAAMQRKPIDRFKQNYAGEAELVTIMQLQVGNTHWYLANGALESHLSSLLSPARNTALISTVISIVVSVIALLLLLKVLYQPIIQLRETLAELAQGKGDLTKRLKVANEHDDLGIITKHINGWISNNQAMLTEIRDLSAHLGNAIKDINASAEENLETLSAHVNQTDLVVTAIEELNVTAKNVVLQASNAKTLGESVNQTGESSRTIVVNAQNNVMTLINDVRSTAQDVKAMSAKTENISTISEVIGGVADQTNLLALNAAIEAARAGEHGRGFAVVADEVRHLASRTQSNTSEIDNAVTSLINTSSTIVDKMELTSQAGETAANEAASVTESLSNLTQVISDMNQITVEISYAAEEQSRVSDEVTQNVIAISTMASQVSENMQGSAKHVNNMAAMYSQLSSMVSAFKI